MRKSWIPRTVGILLMAGLFLAGCTEKKAEETTSRAPFEQAPPTVPGQPGAEEGAKSPEQAQSETSKEQKPARERTPGPG